jgi:uncharacterized protein YndB with AHSA1/START domain
VPASTSPLRSAVAPAEDLVLVHRAELPLSAPACFRLFTTAAGLTAWLCERASVDAELGGRYELFWDLAEPEHDSTIGCRITAFEPDRLVAFQWRSPRQFAAFANAADPLTHVVVTLHPIEHGCAVTLVHSGWRSAPEWREAAEWQRRAWDLAFRALTTQASAPRE